MTKKKLNELVLAACTEFGASAELTAKLNELTAPKVGGGASDVNDYTCFGEDGKPEFIFCNIHKKWEPVVDAEGNELFKVNEKVKNGYDRECMEGTAAWKEANKSVKASKTAIMQDLLDEVITGAEAKEQIAALGDIRSHIGPREDGLGQDEKPCGEAK